MARPKKPYERAPDCGRRQVRHKVGPISEAEVRGARERLQAVQPSA